MAGHARGRVLIKRVLKYRVLYVKKTIQNYGVGVACGRKKGGAALVKTKKEGVKKNGITTRKGEEGIPSRRGGACAFGGERGMF